MLWRTWCLLPKTGESNILKQGHMKHGKCLYIWMRASTPWRAALRIEVLLSFLPMHTFTPLPWFPFPPPFFFFPLFSFPFESYAYVHMRLLVPLLPFLFLKKIEVSDRANSGISSTFTSLLLGFLDVRISCIFCVSLYTTMLLWIFFVLCEILYSTLLCLMLFFFYIKNKKKNWL